MRAAGGGSIINFTSISYMMADTGYAILHQRQFGHQRHDAHIGARVRTRSYPRQCRGPRLGADTTAEGPLGDAGEPVGASGEAKLKDTIAPEDMVGGVLFLASRSARMMTGQAMVIDGAFVVTG